jgi:hypothetical protein
MVTDGATDSGAGNGVMAGEMPGDAAHGRALQATCGVGFTSHKGERRGCDNSKRRFHMHLQARAIGADLAEAASVRPWTCERRDVDDG